MNEPEPTAPAPVPHAPAPQPTAAGHQHPGRAVPWPPAPEQRGLAAPYPPGGFDPDPEAGLREERRYLRLLVAMVIAIVAGGFTLSIIAILLGFGGSR